MRGAPLCLSCYFFDSKGEGRVVRCGTLRVCSRCARFTFFRTLVREPSYERPTVTPVGNVNDLLEYVCSADVEGNA